MRLPVNYFPPNLDAQGLGELTAIAMEVVVPRSARLGQFLIGVIVGEHRRQGADGGDGDKEPGFPELDLPLWSNAELADGLRSAWMFSSGDKSIEAGKFADEILKQFMVVCDCRLRGRPDAAKT